ncbi:MAG TPA: B3/4 domain-containing protein [Polyangiaceae bacterium]|nr:MAG: phenylalanyl-tRNA synthetase subunit beta [Deltaproteobacteria bacterium ADurb.Bin207]HNS99876.1 B3/4 domain-containing protein [Polyangiaceae bacterium]HNZ22245.1 B3/4 domain-containing protein [Polyangiaceae bacterium]HOD22239.1 B3/4 domain-containing protein [Polyangiaceae bacterium]HOE47069.1 B3/4 domain-containing protein [Polyangiaceae bacterium]
MIDIRWSLDHPDLWLGFVQAQNVRWSTTEQALHQSIAETVERMRHQPWPAETTRAAIRDLLRRGGFKPTGRSKPASEYLANTAVDSFPLISNLVDINNLVSLQTGWPCSVLDLDLVGTKEIEVRFGRKQETYVFNSAGQSIDVAGLICLCRLDGDPIANPVKDSMSTKVRESTTRALFVTYTSRRIAQESELQTVLDRVASYLRDHAGASETETQCMTGLTAG